MARLQVDLETTQRELQMSLEVQESMKVHYQFFSLHVAIAVNVIFSILNITI